MGGDNGESENLIGRKLVIQKIGRMDSFMRTSWKILLSDANPMLLLLLFYFHDLQKKQQQKQQQ